MPNNSRADEDILQQAKERFKFCQDWEAQSRENFRADQRFDAGDSVNRWQWPDELYMPRIGEAKPCLTVNKVHQHVLQVTNDARQNKPSVTIKPTGNSATFKASQVLEGIVRQIEVHSSAGDAYDCATNSQTVSGIGWWRVVCEYSDDQSFDQQIFIRRITDALSVYMDPGIKQLDGSDAEYAFVFIDMPKAQFNKKYPKFKDQVGQSSALGEENHQNEPQSGEMVRVCEYFRRIEKHDTLHHLDNGQTVKESEVKDAGLMDQLKINSANPKKTRDIISYEVEWYLLAGGDLIIDRNIWPGSMIPLVRIVGEERVVGGKLDRNGLVRGMLDSQRTYNVMNSAAVESVGVQTKVPWLVAAEAIEGVETQWKSANTKNYAYLVWNSYDDVGQRDIPKPERTEPPAYPQAYQQGIQQAATDMQGASGQYEASFGQTSNERSGVAINSRVRNGNNATFHFINNLSVGIRYTGRIILELIPIVYDTPDRILKILGEDGTQSTVAIDPNMATAHRDVNGNDDESFSAQQVALVLNPSVGKYSVECDTGPNYGTRRMETFNALTQILSQNESLSPVLADLMFKSADFPLADEIAERLRNMVPEKALGIGPSQETVALQQQLAQQHQIMVQQSQELQTLKSKALATEEQKEIDWYKANTSRIDTMGKIDAAALMPIVRELVSQVLGQPVNPLINAHMQENSQMILAAQQPQASQQQPQQGPAQQ